MRALVVVAMLVGVFFTPAWGGSGSLADGQETAGVEKSLGELLDLWREGKLSEVYDHTRGGKQSREAFSRKLAAAPLRPACCWQKVQDLTVRLDGEGRATVRAKLGFEGGGGTEFKTGSWKLVKEDGTWAMSRTDILSLAGAGKKKKGSHRTYRKANH